MKNRKNRKAFTLIELLVVIAIIAILSVVVILSLNPAELLRQSRDSNRISDMATLKSAISLYLADVSSPFIGTSSACNASVAAFATSVVADVPNISGTWVNPTSTLCASWFFSNTAATGTVTTTAANQRGVGGWMNGSGGWIPVNFNAISSGAPIGTEPIDAVNTLGTGATKANGGLFYSYTASGTTFKLGAFMESAKYSTGGSADVETNDGGNNAYVYEQGTALGL